MRHCKDMNYFLKSKEFVQKNLVRNFAPKSFAEYQRIGCTRDSPVHKAVPKKAS